MKCACDLSAGAVGVEKDCCAVFQQHIPLKDIFLSKIEIQIAQPSPGQHFIFSLRQKSAVACALHMLNFPGEGVSLRISENFLCNFAFGDR